MSKLFDEDYPGSDENYVGVKRNNPKAEEICGSVLKKMERFKKMEDI